MALHWLKECFKRHFCIFRGVIMADSENISPYCNKLSHNSDTISHLFLLYRWIVKFEPEMEMGKNMPEFFEKSWSAKRLFMPAMAVLALFSIVSGTRADQAPTKLLMQAASADSTCKVEAGQAALEVTVDNLQTTEGQMRAQIYSSNPDDFLAKGKKLVRVDVPVETLDGPVICVLLPAPGTYALVVMHDKNANGKADFFSEGFGFSNNPKLSLAPPDGEDVMFVAEAGVSKHVIELNYIFGSDDKKKKKRRKLKRR